MSNTLADCTLLDLDSSWQNSLKGKSHHLNDWTNWSTHPRIEPLLAQWCKCWFWIGKFLDFRNHFTFRLQEIATISQTKRTLPLVRLRGTRDNSRSARFKGNFGTNSQKFCQKQTSLGYFFEALLSPQVSGHDFPATKFYWTGRSGILFPTKQIELSLCQKRIFLSHLSHKKYAGYFCLFLFLFNFAQRTYSLKVKVAVVRLYDFQDVQHDVTLETQSATCRLHKQNCFRNRFYVRTEGEMGWFSSWKKPRMWTKEIYRRRSFLAGFGVLAIGLTTFLTWNFWFEDSFQASGRRLDRESRSRLPPNLR